jgi:hypothetical protein
MASALRIVMPMSSRPSRKRSRVESSSGNSTSSPMAGAARVRRSTSIVSSRVGSASMARSSSSPTSADTCTGTRPFFVQLLRKMSAKRGLTTAWKP